MKVSIHNPQVSEVVTLGASRVIALTERGKRGGTIDIFVDMDWAVWDRIVAAVGKYRSEA